MTLSLFTLSLLGAMALGVPMGVVFSALLVSSGGISWILLHSLWRQLTGRMPAEELVIEPAGSVE